ncbi:MAG: DUF4215 domain-containing protein [Myxococcota bacterium]
MMSRPTTSRLALLGLAGTLSLVACEAEPETQTEFIEASTFLQCGEGYDNTAAWWYKLAEHGVWCQASALDGDAAATVTARYPGLVVPKKSSTWAFTRRPVVEKMVKVITVASRLNLEEAGALETWSEAQVTEFTRSLVALAAASTNFGHYKNIDEELFLRRGADGRHHGIMNISDVSFPAEVFDTEVGWDLLHNIDFGATLYRRSWALAERLYEDGEAPCIDAEPNTEAFFGEVARSAFSIYDGGSADDVCRWTAGLFSDDRDRIDNNFFYWKTWGIDENFFVVDYDEAEPDVADIDFAGILGLNSALTGFTCSDNLVRGDETCDDGNLDPGDGCDASCQVEPGFECEYEPSLCVTVCGDGFISTGEACDDGNDQSGDGCSAGCAIETGYACSGVPSVCTSQCGDGVVAVGDEGCDDGDAMSGDGCSASCQVEPGFSCGGSPSQCETDCGDGQIVGNEECDDANVDDGDGCNAGCRIEAGYACSGSPSQCGPDCGDGVIADGFETCDDGNESSGDGCNAACEIEPGWTCDGPAGTPCDAICGDGQIVSGEGCDDGNLSSFDGCSQTCAVEADYTCSGEPSDCRKEDGPSAPPGPGNGSGGGGSDGDPGSDDGGRDGDGPGPSGSGDGNPDTDKPGGYDPEGPNPALNGGGPSRFNDQAPAASACSVAHGNANRGSRPGPAAWLLLGGGLLALARRRRPAP